MFRQKRKTAKEDPGEVAIHSAYPFRLSLYSEQPDTEITLDDFEQWAIDRLYVLGELDRHMTSNRRDLEQSMRPVLQKYLPLSSGAGVRRTNYAERRKDHYSHYILRLAFCRNPDLRGQFIRLESALFKLRYESDDIADRRGFVASLDLAMEEVSSDEQASLEDELVAASGNKTTEDKYFKVDWTRVPDLVMSRRVLVRKGMAYVPESYQVSLLVSEYQSQLDKSLEKLARGLPGLDEDERLGNVLDHLSKGFGFASNAPETTDAATSDKLTADMIDGFDKAGHLPLCMDTIHRQLQVTHKAKYQARVQFTRFLKYVGLNAEEALRYWRKSFANMTEDDFNKEHRYNIRHQYGLEGSKINYRATECSEIVRDVPTGDQTHGCPYRYMSKDALADSLRGLGITDKVDLAEIRQLKDKQLYHMACTKVYELTHPNDKTIYDSAILHPNTYFTRSYTAAKKTS